MTDYFALLGEPRRPWLEVNALKLKFQSMGAANHPDRFHEAGEMERRAAEARFAGLNSAMRCLSDTKERLQHLLALEGRVTGSCIQSVPPELGGVFVEVGEALRHSEVVLREKSAASSPLLKVQSMQRALDCTEHLRALQTKVASLRDAAEAGLAALNPAWDEAPRGLPDERNKSQALDAVERIHRVLSFAGRWSAQLQGRMVELTL
ncbi:MAG: hypothetical protein FJ386_12240 [Verrucomicrobia bacterium]|nr:hypothetical protein [Verrucomicrobiota bacterium]